MHGVIQECKSERARRIRHRHAADDTVYCWNIIRSTLYYSITTKINISPLLLLVITHKRTKYKVMMQNLPADCRLIQKEIVAQCCDSLYCWVCDGLGCCCFYAFPLPFVFFFFFRFRLWQEACLPGSDETSLSSITSNHLTSTYYLYLHYQCDTARWPAGPCGNPAHQPHDHWWFSTSTSTTCCSTWSSVFTALWAFHPNPCRVYRWPRVMLATRDETMSLEELIKLATD